MRHLSLAMLLLLAAGTAGAQTVYKCVGADGRQSYQDHSCDGASAQSTVAPAAPPRAATATDHYNAYLDMVDRERAQKRADTVASAQAANAAPQGDDISSEDEGRRRLCNNDLDVASMKHEPLTFDCDAQGYKHPVTQPALVVAPQPVTHY